MTDSAFFFGDIDEMAAYDIFSVDEAEDLLFMVSEILAAKYRFKAYPEWVEDCKRAMAGRPGGFPPWLLTEQSCRRRYAETIVHNAKLITLN